MQITHVIRGDDQSTTPRAQINILKGAAPKCRNTPPVG